MSFDRHPRNVTFIEDLPELEDLESSHGSSHHWDKDPRFQKFIRPVHQPPSQAGMTSGPYKSQNISSESFRQQQPEESLHINNTISCLEISHHVKKCPICTLVYKGDKTVYIIGLIVLSIICVILLKKVLDK